MHDGRWQRLYISAMQLLPPAAPTGSARNSVVTLALLAACILGMRVHLYTQPLDRDITNYAVLAREWATGRPLYTDLWLHSPPGIVWVYRVTQILVGDGPQQMFALGLTCAVTTLLAVYAAVVAATQSRVAGRWAALLWMLFSGSLSLQCSQPNCEAPMVTCLAVALALLLQRPSKAWQRYTLLGVAGLLLALDSLIKQITLPLTAGVALSMIVWPLPSITRRRALLEAAVLLAGTLVAWLGLFLQLKLNGTFAAFWELNFTFNFAYSRVSGSSGMLANLVHIWKPWPHPADFDRRWLLVMLGVTTLIGCSAQSNISAYARGLVAATAAGSLLALALPGNFFWHYYQLILPNICIATGLVAAVPFGWNKLRSTLLGAVTIVVFYFNARHYTLTPTQWTLLEFHDPIDVLCVQLQTDLKALLGPGQTFFEWGDEPQLFFYANRPSPTGYLFAYTVLGEEHFQGPWSQEQTDRGHRAVEQSETSLARHQRCRQSAVGEREARRVLEQEFSALRRDAVQRVSHLPPLRNRTDSGPLGPAKLGAA